MDIQDCNFANFAPKECNTEKKILNNEAVLVYDHLVLHKKGESMTNKKCLDGHQSQYSLVTCVTQSHVTCHTCLTQPHTC